MRARVPISTLARSITVTATKRLTPVPACVTNLETMHTANPRTRILHARGWLGTAFSADGDRLGVVPDEDRDAIVWPQAADCRPLPALTRYSASLRSTLTAEEWHQIATEVRAELAAVVPWNAEGPAIEATIAAYNRAEVDALRRRNEATPTPRYGALAIDHPFRPGYGPTVNRRTERVAGPEGR
jgi:hypothetical protein